MKAIFLLFLFFVTTAFAGTATWSNMRVKYGPSKSGAGIEYFWPVPNTMDEVPTSIWQTVTVENDLNVQFVAVSEKDFSFTPFYDSNGYISGAQICQPSATILSTGPSTFDPTAAGINEHKTINGVDYICSRFLLVSPQVLRAGGRTHITTIGDSLWVLDTTSELGYKQIPVDLDVLLENTLFIRRGCYPAMGDHYYYNFTTNFDCDKFGSWFLLGQNNDVTGIGWQVFGKPTVFEYNWWDKLIPEAAPAFPDCVNKWFETYGPISIHIYFQDDPWTITCA